VRFNLETITRDPLKVPVLTEKYWATMPDVPGSDLARTLLAVRRNAVKQLPRITDLPAERQPETESDGIRRSLDYARSELGL
jgi:hypothetical protein